MHTCNILLISIKFLVFARFLILNLNIISLRDLANIDLTRLIASGRVIKFESSTRSKSWRFVLTRLESLGNSILEIEINNSSRFLYLKSKLDSKSRLESPRLSISIKKF